MISLALPLGLLALLALAVPLIVHLWRPPPRTVRVGSLRLLREATRLPVRNLRWRDLLLLALRCLLLIVLALLLARPLWHRSLPAGTKWALRSPQAKPSPEQEKAWGELRRQGYEERWLAPGYPQTRPTAAEAPDVWSLLAEADARLPLDGALAVLAPTSLRTLRGNRPDLQRGVRWVEAGAGEKTWVENCRPLPSPDLGLATIGVSKAGETRFIPCKVPAEVPKIPVAEGSDYFEFAPSADGVKARARGEEWQTPRAISAPKVAVLHDRERAEDAQRLRAAVSALEWHLVEAAGTADWVIALGEVQVPSSVGRVLRDAGPAAAVKTDGTFAGQRLFQRVAASALAPSRVLQRDGYGDPLVVERTAGSQRIVQAFLRFHPGWIEAATNSALPVWLGELLQPATEPMFDFRTAALSQAQPVVQAGAAASNAFAAVPTDLSGTLWYLAAMLFALERLFHLRLSPRRA